MSQENYSIRRTITIPLLVTLLALLVLLMLTVFLEPLPGERFIGGAFFLLTLYFLLEAFFRRISLTSEGIELRKLFRKKEFRWDEITHLGCLIMDRKVYALLTTTGGFHILSNNYDKFPRLLESLNRRLGDEKVEREVHQLIEHPLANNKPVRSAWLMATVISAVIMLRLGIF